MNGKESETAGGITSAWSERMRLIRLRRKRERLHFRDELRVIPRWLLITLMSVFVIAQILALLINVYGVANNGVMWPQSNHPVLSSLELAGLVAFVAACFFPWILLLGYVNRDAKRRGMNSVLWTLVCIILMPAYLAIGFIIYFLVREPLPYACPSCGATVAPRFNFCPHCRCNLHPSCPQCRREIVENDKFCAYCGQVLRCEGDAVTSSTALNT